MQSADSNQSKFINSLSEFLNDQVWVSDEEIQWWWTTELCLKCKENNHRVMICFKNWTLSESNQNSRATSVMNSNQNQLEFHQRKEFSSVNILISLNIQIKRTSVEKDESEKTSLSFMKIQCKVQTKFKKWIFHVKMTNNACQLNVIHQFLIKKLKLQFKNLNF